MTGEVDPERSGGQVFPTLVSLLKASSQHFTTNIGKQVSTCVSLPLLCNLQQCNSWVSIPNQGVATS